MKKKIRIRCVFVFPLLLLLVYLGAALSNTLPERLPELRAPEEAPAAAVQTAEREPGSSLDGVFREPDWIAFTVCRMLYEGLSDDGRQAYRSLYEAVLTHKETVYIPSLTSRELSDVHAALKYDNPHLPCISDEFSYGSFGGLFYVKMRYDYTRAECDALSAELVATAKRMCADCAGLDEYGRELRLHDALVRQSDYSDEGVNSNTAAGVLVDRKAVCAGYALGMKLLCDMTGLRSCVVRGTAESVRGTEAHAWLAVRIDGRWYHLDPTWDDPVNENDNSQLTHAYFNLSTEWIGADHRDFTLPEGVTCDSTEDAFYIREGLFCGTGDWRAVIKENLSERLESMPFDVEFRFETGSLFDRAYESLMGGEINEIINELVREEGFPIERWRVASQAFNSMNSIRLIVSDYEE